MKNRFFWRAAGLQIPHEGRSKAFSAFFFEKPFRLAVKFMSMDMKAAAF